MSQENVAVVRQALAALGRGDVEAYLDVASPDIELVNPASALEGPIVGHEGIRRFFRELWTHSDATDFRLEEIRAVDEDRVLALFELTTLGRRSEAETSVCLAGVYDLEGGKIRRAHIYADRAEALEEVGLVG
jgi:ketosteroid isomerase-like protein